MTNTILAFHVVGRKRQAEGVQVAQFALQALQLADALGNLIGFALQAVEQHTAGRFAAVTQGKDFADFLQR